MQVQNDDDARGLLYIAVSYPKHYCLSVRRGMYSPPNGKGTNRKQETENGGQKENANRYLYRGNVMPETLGLNREQNDMKKEEEKIETEEMQMHENHL